LQRKTNLFPFHINQNLCFDGFNQY